MEEVAVHFGFVQMGHSKGLIHLRNEIRGVRRRNLASALEGIDRFGHPAFVRMQLPLEKVGHGKVERRLRRRTAGSFEGL